MKILLISQYFAPEQFRINDMAVALKERGHEVVVLTGMPNYPSGTLPEAYKGGWWRNRRESWRGMDVYRVPMFLRRGGTRWQLFLNYVSFVVSACLLGPWYCRRRPIDAILVFAPSPVTIGIPAALLRRLKKAPVFFWLQDLWPESLSATGAITFAPILGAIESMVRWIYKRCDVLLVQSRAFLGPVVALGAQQEDVRYFPNWAERFYRPRPRDPKLDEALPKGFRLMFAGNFGEAQALDTILDAAEQLKDEEGLQWLFIGTGRRAEWLSQQIVERGLTSSVHLLGQHPAERMPEYFSVADALLVTLKREKIFAYTVPSKVQSYLACGRPLLGSLDGEGGRIINEAGAGYAVPAEDSRALARSVLRLARLDSVERKAMGARGRDYYEQHFERERLIDVFESWLHEFDCQGVEHIEASRQT